jgi:ATP/maltotriose-dependent transcriptional regulator MalT
VTGRRILYGDVLELNQTVLAMDTREAAELLDGRSAASASGLVALANGWPAVIALASVTDAEIDGDAEVPDALYRFFAEEVFDALGEEVRAGLATLAVAPVLDRELAGLLLEDADAVCDAALQVGILEERDGRLELHPLARLFLADRPTSTAPPATEAAQICYRHYSTRRDWDAAFEIVASRGPFGEVAALLQLALDDLLESALLPTIVKWCETAVSSRVDAPIVALARGEVALRRGRHSEAQAFAEVAASGGADDLRFRALSLAGAAAHLASREIEAMNLFHRAEAAASSEVERRDVLRGQLICAIELELPEARDLLSSLVAGVDFSDPREVLRTSSAALAYQLKFGLSDGKGAELAAELVTSVADPLIRSSFRNLYAHWLALSARYSEAADLIAELLDDVARSRLSFAEPYAFVSAATAAAGLRQWSDAHAYIDRAFAAARSERNPFAEQVCYAARVRALAHQGKQRSALSIEVPTLEDAIASIRGEVLTVRGLVLATVGRVDEACLMLGRVRGTTGAVETAVLSAAIEAVVALKRRDSNAAERVIEFEGAAFGSGALDLLVMAYRACPELLARLLRESSDTTRLSALIALVGDRDLVRAIGHSSALDETPARLTPREREVYSLLREGLSNREIATALVITEATAKLHTHHVLEKTGMPSRNEILIQAALERADQATSAMGGSSEADASS